MSEAIPLTVPSTQPGNAEATLECLLFVAGEPVTLAELARALDKDQIATEAARRSITSCGARARRRPPVRVRASATRCCQVSSSSSQLERDARRAW